MAVDDLLRELAGREGSDLHLLEGLPAKARVHGVLETIADESPDTGAWVEGLLDERHREIFARDGETDLAYEVEDAGRFRVNVFRHHGGVGAIFRIIPQTIPTIDELHLPRELNRFTTLSSGLVVITGPTGSGKSSTLAALLNVINQREARHIITIEDPVEFVHVDARSTFTQREVGRDTESAADALRSAARQDPDLLLVGEMRDRETIHLALTLAEMGMLVFSTLHTNSASRTIDRIVEVFPDDQQTQVRAMLAGSLQGVLSQVLCRDIDGSGRIPATELLFTSTALRSVIREGAAHKIESMMQAGRSEGMHRMDDSLFLLAQDGAIAGEEAYRKAEDKSRFLRFVDSS
jgi:twitching motility protein PilT